MQLKEHEGKAIFHHYGLPTPHGVVVKKVAEVDQAMQSLHLPVVVKAQVHAGKRGKAGGIKKCSTNEEVTLAVNALLDKPLLGETVQELLIEECLDIAQEHYAAAAFDTTLRMPIVILSKEGGMDIEEYQKKNADKVIKRTVDALEGLQAWQARELAHAAGFREKEIIEISNTLLKLYDAFVKCDLKLAEINPLILTKEGKLIAGDAKVILDDDANFRRPLQFPPRIGSRTPTSRELAANAVNAEDYRGVAGKVYIDLDGDIGVLASGGGASVTAMDALLSYGGKPANYTEYSGNPTAEKVTKLARIVLSRQGLAGCWIVGGTANFTRIDITIQGIIEALIEAKPDYPIVVRRAGPGDKEAYAMLHKAAEEHGLDIHVFDEHTSITESAKIMVDLSNTYKENKFKRKKKEIKGIIFDFGHTLYEPDTMKLLEDARAVLKNLHGNYKLAIVSRTENPAKRRQQLKDLGIEQFFDFVEAIPKDGIATKDFTAILNHFGFRPNEILVVGDRITSEITQGNKLGMQTCRFVTGPEKELAPSKPEEKPTYTIYKLIDVLEVVHGNPC